MRFGEEWEDGSSIALRAAVAVEPCSMLRKRVASRGRMRRKDARGGALPWLPTRRPSLLVAKTAGQWEVLRAAGSRVHRDVFAVSERGS